MTSISLALSCLLSLLALMMPAAMLARAGFQSPGLQLSAASPGQGKHPTWSPHWSLSKSAPSSYAEGPFPRWPWGLPRVFLDLLQRTVALPHYRLSIKGPCISDGNTGSGHILPGFKCQLHYLIAVRPWASYLTSLCFSSLNSQIVMKAS